MRTACARGGEAVQFNGQNYEIFSAHTNYSHENAHQRHFCASRLAPRKGAFCFHIPIFQSFHLAAFFMRKSPTTNLSKWGAEVINSCFAPKYAKNEALAQVVVYQENIVLAGQKDNSRVAKAPFLHPESSALGIPYTMFLETKRATLGVQERCFWKTAQPLPVCKSRRMVNKS